MDRSKQIKNWAGARLEPLFEPIFRRVDVDKPMRIMAESLFPTCHVRRWAWTMAIAPVQIEGSHHWPIESCCCCPQTGSHDTYVAPLIGYLLYQVVLRVLHLLVHLSFAFCALSAFSYYHDQVPITICLVEGLHKMNLIGSCCCLMCGQA